MNRPLALLLVRLLQTEALAAEFHPSHDPDLSEYLWSLSDRAYELAMAGVPSEARDRVWAESTEGDP